MDEAGKTSESGRLTHRVVVGALRTAIHHHGPISERWVPSAAKRIHSALLAAAADHAVHLAENGEVAAVERRWRKRMSKLQNGHKRTVAMCRRFEAERDALLLALESGWSHGQYQRALVEVRRGDRCFVADPTAREALSALARLMPQLPREEAA